MSAIRVIRITILLLAFTCSISCAQILHMSLAGLRASLGQFGGPVGGTAGEGLGGIGGSLVGESEGKVADQVDNQQTPINSLQKPQQPPQTTQPPSPKPLSQNPQPQQSLTKPTLIPTQLPPKIQIESGLSQEVLDLLQADPPIIQPIQNIDMNMQSVAVTQVYVEFRRSLVRSVGTGDRGDGGMEAVQVSQLDNGNLEVLKSVNVSRQIAQDENLPSLISPQTPTPQNNQPITKPTQAPSRQPTTQPSISQSLQKILQQLQNLDLTQPKISVPPGLTQDQINFLISLQVQDQLLQIGDLNLQSASLVIDSPFRH